MTENPSKPELKLNRTDLLAVDRTRLANERTFLAYFRTFVVFLGTGFAIVRLQLLEEIRDLGWVLIYFSPILLLIGWSRFVYVKKRLSKYYREDFQQVLKK